ncbi:hypothetical protein LTR37_004717 [Vermiconidia calcicola]|uniref:Uncharacterized protein n=1 Tax=Vermiconidia calcicola TaxID=1690605 RepID=A0ACC3NLZ8_9PEZI|nr:hypothetical protein LTR37_004717 [Vermiconidia calcicola]
MSTPDPQSSEELLCSAYDNLNTHLGSIYKHSGHRRAFLYFMLRHVYTVLPITELPVGDLVILHQYVQEATKLYTDRYKELLWPKRDPSIDDMLANDVETYLVALLQTKEDMDPVLMTLLGVQIEAALAEKEEEEILRTVSQLGISDDLGLEFKSETDSEEDAKLECDLCDKPTITPKELERLHDEKFNLLIKQMPGQYTGGQHGAFQYTVHVFTEVSITALALNVHDIGAVYNQAPKIADSFMQTYASRLWPDRDTEADAELKSVLAG